MRAHKYADFFPSMGREEFDGLVEDIRERGLIDDVETYQGKILDGRHRYKACKRAGVEPRFVEFEGTEEEALRYVVSRNLHRRGLSATQRAVVGQKLLPEYERFAAERQEATRAKPGERVGEGRSASTSTEKAVQSTKRAMQARDQVAEVVGGVSGRTIQKVKRVLKDDPKLEKDMLSGKLSADAAYKQVTYKEKAVEKIRKSDSKLVKQYLDSLKSHGRDLDEFGQALDVIRDLLRGEDFSPEARGFITRKHKSIVSTHLELNSRLESLGKELFGD